MTFLVENDPIKVALAEIAGTYGANVSVLNKKKSLLKFGKNPNVGTSWTTIQEFQGGETNEAYSTANDITHVISDNASNTMVVTIEGHTVDGSGNLTFTIQNATLNGTAAVTLTTPLCRATRIAVKEGTFASPSTDMQLSSNVYVYEGGTTTSGVPDTASETHILMTADSLKPNNQSFKASTSLSSSDYALISSIYFDVNKKTTASVDVRFEVRNSGGVWRPRLERTISSTADNAQTFELIPYIIVPPNADIRLVALSSVSNTSITAGFNAFLAN